MPGNTVTLIQNFGDLISAQEGHQPLKTVVQPAHHLDVHILQNVFILSRCFHFRKLAADGIGKLRPAGRGHPGHPFLQRGGNKSRGRFECGAQHVPVISQLPVIRIAQLVLHNDATLTGLLMVLPDKVFQGLAPAGKAQEIHSLRLSGGQEGKHIIPVGCFRSVQHELISWFSKNFFWLSALRMPEQSRRYRRQCGSVGKCYPAGKFPDKSADRCTGWPRGQT